MGHVRLHGLDISIETAMLTTLLVIAASIAAGIIVSHVHPEYRKR